MIIILFKALKSILKGKVDLKMAQTKKKVQMT